VGAPLCLVLGNNFSQLIETTNIADNECDILKKNNMVRNYGQ